MLKYALAVAGQSEPWPAELGPIHLIKYAYLGDLAYATKHDGQTFTGVPWTFYHYGPWSPEVYGRIAPVVRQVGASQKRLESRFSEEDYTRFVLHDDEGSLEELVRELEPKLPLETQLAIKRAVRTYGGDTSGLLHYVYKTDPMLHAAPNERLNFSFAQQSTAHGIKTTEAESSYKEQKRRKERLKAAREKVAKRLEEVRPRREVEQQASLQAENDVEAAEIAQWLNELAGGQMKPIEGEIEFSDAIWKSPGRWEKFDK